MRISETGQHEMKFCGNKKRSQVKLGNEGTNEPTMTTPFYESDAALAQYLLFHYGTPGQICPLVPEARTACGFPARCVSESMRHIVLAGKARALDLGCAVGRGSFELGRHFKEVVGIDFSERFVAAARRMGQERAATVPPICGPVRFILNGAMRAICGPISGNSTWC